MILPNKKLPLKFRSDDRVTTKNPYDVPSGKNYVIIVGKEHKDVEGQTSFTSILDTMITKLFNAVDTVYYVLGEYQNIEDAVAAQTELENKGVKS